MKTRRHRERGSTLIGLLIVLLLIGGLAALVVPSFELAELNDVDLSSTHDETAAPATHGETAAPASSRTDSLSASLSRYGPYIRTVPTNPVNGLDTVQVCTVMPDGPNDESGWLYATSNGEFRSNASGTGPDGTRHFDL